LASRNSSAYVLLPFLHRVDVLFDILLNYDYRFQPRIAGIVVPAPPHNIICNISQCSTWNLFI